MTFSLKELAHVLSLRAAGKKDEARQAFLRFDSAPEHLLSLLYAFADLDDEARRSKIAAVLLDCGWGKGWVCYERKAMKSVTKPGRLPVIPLLELRDFLTKLREG